MKKTFDLVVIGTGSAASGVASRCRAAGWTVAIVDSRPFGGTCALRGCDPKKVLVGAAEAIDRIRRLDGKGIVPAGTRIDWRGLMAFKRSIIAAVPRSREEGFAKKGMEHVLRQGTGEYQQIHLSYGPTRMRNVCVHAPQVATKKQPCGLVSQAK